MPSAKPRSSPGTSARAAKSPTVIGRVDDGRHSLKNVAHAVPVLRQFRELFRVSQQHFQRIESACGVSGAQLWALTEISTHPGMTVSELARTLSVHLSTASNLLDKLEVRKLVRRQRAASDQRVVRVYVTEEGEAVLAEAPQPAEGVIQDALRRMPEAALVRLHRDLGLLLELAAVRDRKGALKHMGEP